MSGFIVTKFSRCTYQFIRVGKVHASIEAALAAATRIDRKNNTFAHFVDLYRPSTGDKP